MKVTEQVWQMAEPIVTAQGCSLWDVEYVREGGGWYLRIYIDKDPYVDIDDCEAVSRAMDPLLDEADPIPDSYTFEVCSAGLERVLRLPAHFAKCIGERVTVRLYRPRNGTKELVGTLQAYEDGAVTLLVGEETVCLSKAEVAQVRLQVDF